MSDWIFVDDRIDEATAFAEQFANSEHPVNVTPVLPQVYRDEVLTGRLQPSGVLLDVDLSSITGEHGSGPGLAQDTRVKQLRDIPAFPVVRFAWRQKVDENVGGDTSSNDLFDLKIQKEDLKSRPDAICKSLHGVHSVYKSLLDTGAKNPLDVLGLNEETASSWSDEALHARLAAELHLAPHAAALLLMRTLVFRPGLLVDEFLLSVRLGVDSHSDGWSILLEDLDSFRYRGFGWEWFPRWWARGLEDWWYERFGADTSLAGLTIQERVERLGAMFQGLSELEMPKGSAGSRPWRLCQLALEATPPRLIPVDPAMSVRVLLLGDYPPWVDPAYASVGEALGLPDKRLNRQDVVRLQRQLGSM